MSNKTKKLIKSNKNGRRIIRELGAEGIKISKVKRFLDEKISTGKLVGVHWDKKDGEHTTGTFTKKKWTGGGYNTTANLKQYKNGWDTNRKDPKTGRRGRWVNINLPGVKVIKCEGKEYHF